MKKTILTSAVAMIACAAPAFAADFNGNIEIGTQYNKVIGNGGKANEYRDAGLNQAIADFGFGLSHKSYYLELEGKSGFNLNATPDHQERADQSYLLKGGKYENFKYSLFFKEIPHNMTFGAQSHYPGVGSSVLIAPFLASASAPAASTGTPPVSTTPAAVATAKNNVIALKNTEQAAPKTSFDYALTRKNYGASLEVSLNTPFFLSARAERNETHGIMPLGTYLGQQKEIPIPINYVTDNLYLETGYRTKGLIATIDGTVSNFSEQSPNVLLGFTNANSTLQSQTISLPPSNLYFKVGGNVKYNMPFMKSTLMARGSYSKMTNEQTLFDRVTGNTGTATLATGNGTVFKGDIHYTTASASVTSSPTDKLDTRVFINFLNKQNESTQEFNYTSGAGTNLTETFGYHKINGGFDAGYKLPAKTKLSAGYEYQNLVRALREDATKTTDHIGYVQVKNELLHWMSAKVRAQHMYREGKFTTETDSLGQAGTGYFRPFDAATKTQDSIKFGIELEPMHNVSLGLEYAYKIDQYRDSIMGLQNSKNHDIYFDSNIIAGPVKINPYFDLEIADQSSTHRVGNNAIGTNLPTTVGATGSTVGQTAMQYDWRNDARNVFYALGLNTEITLVKDFLTANVGARYENSDGSERFSTGLTTADIYNPIVNNKYLDTYIKKSINGKLTAMFTKQLKATASYTFEDLKYTDDHYTGYNNYVLGEAGGGYLLTGAYNNPNYTAHIGFVSLAYNF